MKRQYWGESSRSAFQRGEEHEAEIRMGKISHPMVQHFWEEHGGRIQPVLMRVTSKHLVALERQVRESVNIEKCAKEEDSVLLARHYITCKTLYYLQNTILLARHDITCKTRYYLKDTILLAGHDITCKT